MSDEAGWFGRSQENTPSLRSRIEALEAEVARLRETRRWNINRTDGGEVLLCRGDHKRSDECDYERWVPADRAKELEAEMTRLKKGLTDNGCEIVTDTDGNTWVRNHAKDCAKALEAEVARLRETLRGLLHHEIAHVGPGAHEAVMAARAALRKEETP